MKIIIPFIKDDNVINKIETKFSVSVTELENVNLTMISNKLFAVEGTNLDTFIDDFFKSINCSSYKNSLRKVASQFFVNWEQIGNDNNTDWYLKYSESCERQLIEIDLSKF